MLPLILGGCNYYYYYYSRHGVYNNVTGRGRELDIASGRLREERWVTGFCVHAIHPPSIGKLKLIFHSSSSIYLSRPADAGPGAASSPFWLGSCFNHPSYGYNTIIFRRGRIRHSNDVVADTMDDDGVLVAATSVVATPFDVHNINWDTVTELCVIAKLVAHHFSSAIQTRTQDKTRPESG